MTSTPKYYNQWHQYREYDPVDLNLIKKDQIYMLTADDGESSGIVTIRSIVNGVIEFYYNDSITNSSGTITIENPGNKKLFEPIPIEVGGKRTRRNRKSRKVKKLRRKRTRRN